MNNRIRVDFNGKFYSARAVKRSAYDYKGVADTEVKIGKRNIVVFLYNFDEGLSEKIGDEFANYVLFIEGTLGNEKASKVK